MSGSEHSKQDKRVITQPASDFHHFRTYMVGECTGGTLDCWSRAPALPRCPRGIPRGGMVDEALERPNIDVVQEKHHQNTPLHRAYATQLIFGKGR
jgi:hypothetical protein